MGRQERAEQRQVATALRAEGRTWVEIAATLRARWPELNARAAMRIAHGWNQSDAAEAWNRLWPDRSKNDKDIGLWELRRPGFATLDRLAQLYECSVADLIADIGDYRHLDEALDEASDSSLPVHARDVEPDPRWLTQTSVPPFTPSADAGATDRWPDTIPPETAQHPSPQTPERWPAETSDPDDLEAIELLRRVEATDTGPATLAAIGTGVDRLCRSYTYVAPATLLASLRAFQSYLSRLLDGRASLAHRKELMRHAGWVSLLTATADIDLGYDRAAAANFGLAHKLATETGDLSLAAWTFETEAWQALSSGDALRAAALCRAGLDHAPAGTSAYAQLYTQSARVAARLGDAHGTYRLVDECVTVVDRLPPSDEPEHQFVCDPRRAISFCAAALVWLGDNNARAEEYARRAVAQYETDPRQWVHRLAAARLNLALMLARTGEPAEAAYLGGQALDAGWRLCRTDLFLLADLNQVLTGRYAGNIDVTQFHDHYLSVRRNINAQGTGGTDAGQAQE
jgi:hypothetical protein